MSTPGSDDPLSTPPRRRPPRQMDISKLYETLQQETPRLDKLRTNAIGIKLVLIPEGTFLMGSSPAEPQRRSNEGPRHEVALAQPFYIAIHPVTQDQYQKVMGKNPARFHRDNGGSFEHPVENVSWEDAQTFCQRLTQMPAEQGLVYRLPTEAEWEYACRAGTTGPFSFGEALTATQANIDGEHPYGSARKGPSVNLTSRVGVYPANNFGLFDMHGNVWEWCADWYDGSYYGKAPPRDPPGPREGTLRVVRGGAWRNQAATCRSAYRNALVPYNRDPYTGFRVVAAAK